MPYTGMRNRENKMDTINKSVDYAQEVFDNIASAGSHAVETLGEKGDDLLNAEQKLMKQCRRYIRHNPRTSVGIAVVAGFLLSSLFRGR